MSAAAAKALDHARHLLKQFPLIDGHNDLPWVVHSSKQAGMSIARYDLSRLHPETDTDTPRLKEGHVAAQFFAAFTPTLAEKPGRMTLELIDLIRQISETDPANYQFATSANEIKRAFRDGKIAVLATVEGCTGLENSLNPLRVWHKAGVRLVTLCHNETLDWVDSATDVPRHNGLTKFGEAVVLELNRLGIIVDLAHAAPKTMHKVLDISRAPVLFSHNNALSLCDHPRNAPDDVLDRIRSKKSVIMATFIPDFINQKARDWSRPLRDNYGKSSFLENHEERVAAHIAVAGPQPKATIGELCDHIEYLTSRTGLNHIGIGSDYYGGITPEGLEDVSKFPYLIAALIERGWYTILLPRKRMGPRCGLNSRLAGSRRSCRFHQEP